MSRVFADRRRGRRLGLIAALSLGLLGSLGATGASAGVMSGTGRDPVFTAGPGETNNLRVTQQPAGVTVWDDDVAITGVPAQCSLAAGNATCTSAAPAKDVNVITINLGDGNDSTTFTTVVAEYLRQYGEGGNDTLRGSDDSYTTTEGGEGNDTLTSGRGDTSTSLRGEAGNDTITGSADPTHDTGMYGDAGSDTFIAGAGRDTVRYDTQAAAAVTVTADGIADDGAAGENDNVAAAIDEIYGTGGDDTIAAGPGANVLYGFDGKDTFTGGGGDDYMEGGGGNDSLSGGGGDDRLIGERGADDLRGGDGVDAVTLSARGPDPDNLPLDIGVTLDDIANDGAAGEGDNVHADIEDIETESGNDTITGNAAVQIISGHDGNDSIDGGAGNDILSGNDGNDTLRSRDGFSDRVNCGAGSDSAIVDTIDFVSSNCESVDRADAGNVNQTPDDAPPTVAFTTPGDGAKLPGAPVTVNIAAGDDKAVARVILLDDGRTVGSDDTAPYQVTYAPTAPDVGKNTLIAIAVDGAEQTATAVRAVTVAKFAPRSLSLTLKPARDRKAPYRFTAKGSVLRPGGVTAAQGCTAGQVRLEVRYRGRLDQQRTLRIKRDCSYSIPIQVMAKGRVSFRARFRGNDVLEARSSAAKPARTG